jgi:signal transduction histidine kinase
VQALGAISIALFAFVSAWVLALVLARTVGLRVSPEQEHAGLNWSEHHVTTALNELYHDMTHLYVSKNFQHRVHSEPNTVAGDIATVFNRILERFQEEQARSLALRQRAETAAEAKSNFIATMSHEIRTSMNGVISMVELLLSSELENEQRNMLNTIQASGEALLNIINDILDFSRLEAGQVVYENIPFNVKTLSDQVIDLFRYTAHEKQLVIESVIGDFEYYRFGDPARLRQVLTNLLGNAVKFTDTGYIRLKVYEQEPALLRFVIEDTGIGIDAAQLEHIMSEFTQADSTIARRYGGTGLGLAITKNLLAGMKSDLEVVSEPQKGTEFSFCLPLVKAPSDSSVSNLQVDASFARERDEQASAQLLVQVAGKKVLVVDDNVVNRQVALRILQRMGLIVTEAENGLQCLQRAQTDQYDMIFMDLQMPEMDGITATREIRELPGYVSTPIIAWV